MTLIQLSLLKWVPEIKHCQPHSGILDEFTPFGHHFGKYLQTGWPDWANFCPLGECFFNYKSRPHFTCRAFSKLRFKLRLCIYFYKIGLGVILGDFSQTHLVTLFTSEESSVLQISWADFYVIMTDGSRMCDTDRVTRWVCEKNRPECSPTCFSKKDFITCAVEKKIQKYGHFCNLQKS
jgi:hypothetical protein